MLMMLLPGDENVPKGEGIAVMPYPYLAQEASGAMVGSTGVLAEHAKLSVSVMPSHAVAIG